MASRRKPMTKAQLISTLAGKLDKPKKDVADFINTLNEVAYKETIENDHLILNTFNYLDSNGIHGLGTPAGFYNLSGTIH